MALDAASGAGPDGPAPGDPRRDDPRRDRVWPDGRDNLPIDEPGYGEPEDEGPEDDESWDDEPWDSGQGLDDADVGGPGQEEGPGGSTGFGVGGVLDVLEPCAALAGFAEDAAGAGDQDGPGQRGLRELDDDALTGVLRAWRRLESWSAAGGMAAVAELARRRPADGTVPDLGRALRPPAGILASRGQARSGRLAPAQHASAQPGPQQQPPDHQSGPQQQPPDDQSGPQQQPPDQPAASPEAESPPVPSDSAGFPTLISEFTSDEIAAALVLSGQAAERHLGLALDLARRLPGTNRALRTGTIDVLRARIIADATQTLDAEGAARAEALILPKVASMTAGQVRAAIARAVLKVDPEAARRRREQAARDARVMRWREDAGTAALCGRDLPSAEVLAADQRITARAKELRAAGLSGTMDELRARAYLDFLLDRPLTVPQPESAERPGGETSTESPPGGETSPEGPPVSVPRGLAARINLTAPVNTVLGFSDNPGEVAGFGPIDADTARAFAATASGNPFTSWCLTLTDPDGRAVAHGCGKRYRGRSGGGPHPGPGGRSSPSPGDQPRSGGPPGGQPRPGGAPGNGPRSGRTGPLTGNGPPIPEGMTFTVTPIASRDCDHRNESPGYELSPRLRHLIETRSTRCSFPGCRRPARRCDQDHTTPYDQGGRTCECNLGPLCRHHHRVKQSQGWRLEQAEPGVMVWTTPAGRHYVTGPTSHPC